MYLSKKEGFVLLVILIFFIIVFSLSAEITQPDTEEVNIGVPIDNQSLDEKLNESEINQTEINFTLDIPLNESLPEENVTEEISINLEPEVDLGITADCGGATGCNCADNVTEDYNLSSNLIDCAAIGLRVGAHNIVIDCQGYYITGDSSNNEGFINTGYDNVTIRNCNISGFNEGIEFTKSVNGTIINNTISSTAVAGMGIVIQTDSNLTNIINNTINTTGMIAYGIYLSALNQTTLNNNNVTTGGTQSTAIFINAADNTTIKNCTITTKGGATTSAISPPGITISNSNFANFTSNVFDTQHGQAISFGTTTKLHHFNHSIDTTNTEQDRPIHYYFNNNSVAIENLTDVGQLLVMGSNNVTIYNVNSTMDGIILAKTENSTIRNCNITGAGVYGIYLHSGSNNTQIYNNSVNINGSTGAGIYLLTVSNNNLSNNNVTTLRNYGHGIYVHTRSNNNYLKENNVTVRGNFAYGIRIFSSSINNTLEKNTINTYGSTSYAVEMRTKSNNNTLTENNFTANRTTVILVHSSNYSIFTENRFNTSSNYGLGLSTGSDGHVITGNVVRITSNIAGAGISLLTADDNLVNNNTIRTFGTSGYGIWLNTRSHDNILLNNNITAVDDLSYEILDDTGNGYLNYLIYNNSFGEISWNNHSDDGFLSDLDVNGSIALGKNLLIANNTIALNLSAFTTDLSINSSANLSLFQLNYSEIEQIFKFGNYSNDSVNIRGNGSDQLGSNITLISYGFNTLVFNTTSFSSFSANGSIAGANTAPNTANIFVNSSTADNGTADDLTCWVNGEDGEQSSLRAHWIWYNNSVQYTTGSTLVSNATETAVSTISYSLTTVGENWTCSAIMSDGIANETNWNNGSVFVTNYKCGDLIDADATLIGDVLSCAGNGLNVVAGNITIDCNNSIIQGTGNSTGINVNNTDNVTIINCNISGFNQSIYLNSSLSNISHNVLYNSSYGVYMPSSSKNNNLIRENIIYNHSQAGVYLGYACQFNNILYNNISNSTYGIHADFSSDSNITYNNIYDNEFNLNYLSWVVDPPALNTTNNWWGFSDCENISNNITWVDPVDFDPHLDASYPGGASTACTDHCNMIILESYDLTSDITDCPKNGVTILKGNLTFDCHGHYITGIGNNYTGIYSTSADNTTIQNCRISNFNVSIDSESTNGVINNNSLQLFAKGIKIETISTTHNISNNTLMGNGSSYSRRVGISFGSTGITGSSSNLIENNNLSHLYEAFFLLNTQLNVFVGNTLLNNSFGYNLFGQLNNFTSEKVINQTSIAVLINYTLTFDYLPRYNVFRNSTFTNNTLDLKIFQFSINFTNTTVDKTKILTDELATAYVSWYVDVNITDASGNSVNEANISVYNSVNKLDDTGSTNANGRARLELEEYYEVDDIRYIETPHIIYVSKANFTKNQTAVDIYNLTYAFVNLSITEIGCGSTVTGDLDIASNYNCNDAGLIIGNDNIIINGSNYNLTGANSSIGIDLNGKNNITIVNLNVYNFTTGINFNSSNNSNLWNLDVKDNSYGIIFNSSYDNVIYDSNLTENSLLSVYAINGSGTNNSLVNASIVLDNITANGNAAVFVKWYVEVNVTYNNGFVLYNANTTGYYNSSGVMDYSILADSNGWATLILTEFKLNSSGTNYLTPHNISTLYDYLGTDIVNFTTLNLSQSNNTRLNISMQLNCTTPTNALAVTSNTDFCPGTFELDYISITNDSVNITCANTIFDSLTKGVSDWNSHGVEIANQDKIRITNCTFLDFPRAIYLVNATNVTIINMNASYINPNWCQYCYNSFGTGVYCKDSLNISVNGSSFDNMNSGFYFKNCNDSSVVSNNFSDQTAYVYSSYNNLISNNTFGKLSFFRYYSIEPSGNTSVYYNDFMSISGNHISYFNDTSTNYRNYFNTSVTGGYAQGNRYQDYCDKGADLNNDSFADNVSASGGDWPYGDNTSTKIDDPINKNVGIVDYGPKITTCPAEEVFLGSSSSGGGGGSSSESAAGPAVAAPEVGSQKEERVIEVEELEEFYDAEDAKKHLKTQTAEIYSEEKITTVKLILENTGTKRMSLFPEIFQEIDEPFFIVTTKTLGYGGSFFSRLAHLSYSENSIAGRLLKAEIVDPKPIILEPGQVLEQVIEIKEGLMPQKINIQIKTFETVVTEEEVEITQEAISGTAIDHDQENHVFDLYAIIVPGQLAGELREHFAEGTEEIESSGDEVTASLVAFPGTERRQDEYLLELNIEKKDEEPLIKQNLPLKFFLSQELKMLFTKQSSFSDLYGPYKLKKGQSFIFAQQIRYDPLVYNGDYIIKTKIYSGEKVAVENEFEMVLG